MSRNQYLIMAFLISTLFNSSCGEDTYTETIEKAFCGPCAFTGQWKVYEIDTSPCFKTNEACLDWAKNNGYPNKGCVFCK